MHVLRQANWCSVGLIRLSELGARNVRNVLCRFTKLYCRWVCLLMGLLVRLIVLSISPMDPVIC